MLPADGEIAPSGRMLDHPARTMIPSSISPGALPSALREALAALYLEVDEAIVASGAVCWLRGDCCDFERTDHRLYASSLEIAYVREARPEPFAAEGVLCPFWKAGRCTERERRPLGCRTYFCDPRVKLETEALYERFHSRLKALCEAHGFPYAYLPFVSALRHAGGGSGGDAAR
jgi:Fe-S-cluster containining protein